MMEINESPVFLRLDPAPSPAAKDLPVYLYESGERGEGRDGKGVRWGSGAKVSFFPASQLLGVLGPTDLSL